MTGFGRSTASSGNRKITVEIKTLNSKQLDMSVRIPQSLRELELPLRNKIGSLITRGKADVMVYVETISAEAPVSLDVEIMGQYVRQIREASAALGVSEPTEWYPVLMRMPDVMRQEENTSAETDAESLLAAAGEAAAMLREFRLQEGEKLDRFFREKIETIGSLLAQVDRYEGKRVESIRHKLEEQLTRLTGVEIDKGRLEQELIYYIEKLDVNEEKLRLRSHLNYFLETLSAESDNGHGKKLGFIAQEMGREINTLGSKSNDAAMQRIVVMMKDELEQIKEQVLNVL